MSYFKTILAIFAIYCIFFSISTSIVERTSVEEEFRSLGRVNDPALKIRVVRQLKGGDCPEKHLKAEVKGKIICLACNST